MKASGGGDEGVWKPIPRAPRVEPLKPSEVHTRLVLRAEPLTARRPSVAAAGAAFTHWRGS